MGGEGWGGRRREGVGGGARVPHRAAPGRIAGAADVPSSSMCLKSLNHERVCGSGKIAIFALSCSDSCCTTSALAGGSSARAFVTSRPTRPSSSRFTEAAFRRLRAVRRSFHVSPGSASPLRMKWPNSPAVMNPDASSSIVRQSRLKASGGSSFFDTLSSLRSRSTSSAYETRPEPSSSMWRKSLYQLRAFGSGKIESFSFSSRESESSSSSSAGSTAWSIDERSRPTRRSIARLPSRAFSRLRRRFASTAPTERERRSSFCSLMSRRRASSSRCFVDENFWKTLDSDERITGGSCGSEVPCRCKETEDIARTKQFSTASRSETAPREVLSARDAQAPKNPAAAAPATRPPPLRRRQERTYTVLATVRYE